MPDLALIDFLKLLENRPGLKARNLPVGSKAARREAEKLDLISVSPGGYYLTEAGEDYLAKAHSKTKTAG